VPSLVVDTHAIVWYLSGDSRLSANARAALRSATSAGHIIYVPSVCLVDLTYPVEKGRLPAVARQRLVQALDDPASPCSLVPMDRMVADTLQLVSRAEVPDFPDRIIAATAVALMAPIISCDARITASQVQTIW
jgi:PIN domain nuclease of toxin-antitoxin system